MSGARRKVLVVMGTRPEAIKLAPVIACLSDSSSLEPVVCTTAQQRDLSDQVISAFGLKVDFDLDLMTADQPLNTLMAAALVRCREVIRTVRPAMVVVQGDTTTALAAGMSAFHEGTPIAHVEAGLRSGSLTEPWPEEMNRRILTTLSSLHFAATSSARDNLLKEGVCDSAIAVTGNSVVDAAIAVASRLRDRPMRLEELDRMFDLHRDGPPLIVATLHRREHIGADHEEICRAIVSLAGAGIARFIIPVHPNPNVSMVIRGTLEGVQNVSLVAPLDYETFIHLLGRASLALTDSGGVQEESPSLNTPVLVLRNVTERPEGVAAGVAMLVGTSAPRIVGEVKRLLGNPQALAVMRHGINPYGDGNASARIVARLEQDLVQLARPERGE